MQLFILLQQTSRLVEEDGVEGYFKQIYQSETINFITILNEYLKDIVQEKVDGNSNGNGEK